MSKNRGVMVYCEVEEGTLSSITREILGRGRKIADDLGEELCTLILGSDVRDLSREIISFGADKVYIADDPLLGDYRTDSYLITTEKMVRQVLPKIVIFGQTIHGRDLAPRLAFRLGTSAVLDCVELTVDSDTGTLLQTKPVYGGNAWGVFTGGNYPNVITVRPKTAVTPEPDASRQGQVVDIDAALESSKIRTKVLEKVVEDYGGIKLDEAEVVIAGGRGIGGADGFKQLSELAELLHGAVGASRPPCDYEWVLNTQLVGITGKIVAPTLYLAVALSGSSQHMSGCFSSKNIIAINCDPDANIFQEAHYGVVGDWKEVLPGLIDKIRQLKAE